MIVAFECADKLGLPRYDCTAELLRLCDKPITRASAGWIVRFGSI
jgi:hypothetical protein